MIGLIALIILKSIETNNQKHKFQQKIVVKHLVIV